MGCQAENTVACKSGFKGAVFNGEGIIGAECCCGIIVNGILNIILANTNVNGIITNSFGAACRNVIKIVNHSVNIENTCVNRAFVGS